jgi:DNA-binding transcriptional LysR family regulator
LDLLSAMRLFVRVAETGTISGAGRALGLSTTAASKRLQDLEARLKVRLLNRTTRHVSLTEAGQHLYARLGLLLGELDGALSGASRLHDRPAGVLRVVARRSFGMLHIVPALPSFRAAFPEVDIDLTLTEEVDLRPTHGTDIVIRLGRPPAEKSLVTEPLASARRLLCASPAYLERHPPPSGPDDLARHACLTYRRAHEPTVWVFEGERGRRLIEVPVSGPLSSNSGEALRQAALDGLGLVLLPEWMVARDVAAGRLVACLAVRRAYPAGYQAEIYAVWARGEFVPAKITAFIAHLRAFLAGAS